MFHSVICVSCLMKHKLNVVCVDVLRQGLGDHLGCFFGQKVPGLANDDLGQGCVDKLRVSCVIER